MNDLQKDQAIYQAMLEIADTVFTKTMEANECLKVLIKQYGGFVSLTDICKVNGDFAKNFFMAMRDANLCEEMHEMTVDTFSCSFPSCEVYSLLKYWKSLAKVKCEQVFMYEEKIENEFVGSVEVNIGDSSNAKLLSKHIAHDELRPIMNYIVAEINANTQSIDFVASDGHTLCVISNNPAQVFAERCNTHTTFQALFTPEDWKRICDYAKKNGHKVLFDIYRMKDCESFDTFNVHLGDVCLRSQLPEGRYPNWRSVIPKPDILKYRFNIVPEETKAAQDWVKKLDGKYDRLVNISFYRGSDLVYFDFNDYDFSQSKTATFHLTRPSDSTIGIALNIGRLQKMKFTGFNLEDSTHGAIINCDEADIMLIMPMLNESGYVRDVEEREVLEAVEETAMVVELTA